MTRNQYGRARQSVLGHSFNYVSMDYGHIHVIDKQKTFGTFERSENLHVPSGVECYSKCGISLSAVHYGVSVSNLIGHVCYLCLMDVNLVLSKISKEIQTIDSLMNNF